MKQANRKRLTRRRFLAGGAATAGFSNLLLQDAGQKGEIEEGVAEVMFYEKLPKKKIRCLVCPKECKIAPLERGYCGNKENRDGIYYTLVYGKVCAYHLDPIEKKPLFHYLPGTNAFSIATAGCNFECRFCQNWQIAQARPEQVDYVYLPPEEAGKVAARFGAPTIAYTYTEPVVFYTYMYDTAKAARKLGIGGVMISNGYIRKDPMKKLAEVLTAVKIDLKSFSNEFYVRKCSGTLKPVLDTLALLKELNMWTEIVVLIIPTLNDSPQEIKAMCQWINKNLGPDVPVHFSRFYPQYKLKNLPPTPVKTLETARNIALESGLHYIYIGNVPGHPAESTYCPRCKKVLVRRIGYSVLEMNIKKGKCVFCGESIPGVWENPLKPQAENQKGARN